MSKLRTQKTEIVTSIIPHSDDGKGNRPTTLWLTFRQFHFIWGTKFIVSIETELKHEHLVSMEPTTKIIKAIHRKKSTSTNTYLSLGGK